MTDPMTADALRRFRERVGHLVELIADGDESATWVDVIVNEAARLVEEGPAAYVRYVQRLDRTAMRSFIDSHPDLLRAQLDRELGRILGTDE